MKERKTFTIKMQDFIPFIGSFIYSNRNWYDENNNLKMPQPYDDYSAIGLCLTLFNFGTGLLIMAALSKLL